MLAEISRNSIRYFSRIKGIIIILTVFRFFSREKHRVDPSNIGRNFSGKFPEKSWKISDISRNFPKSRVIPSFRPRFAGKCDRQSRDLTQLTSGYISRLNRLLITPDHHVRTHTWESIAQKYSMENMNIFILYQESIPDTFASKSNAFSTELCLINLGYKSRFRFHFINHRFNLFSLLLLPPGLWMLTDWVYVS